MKKKRILSIIIIISMLIFVGIIIIYIKKDYSRNENITDINTTQNVSLINEKVPVLLRDKITLGMSVTNIVIKEEGGNTHFSAKVQSIEKDIKQKNIVVVFKNSDATDLVKIEVSLPDIKYGEITTIEFDTKEKINKAYSFLFEDIS